MKAAGWPRCPGMTTRNTPTALPASHGTTGPTSSAIEHRSSPVIEQELAVYLWAVALGMAYMALRRP